MNIMERKLTKLTIKAYSDREMRKLVGATKAMYNPNALQLNYQTQYEPKRYINDSTQSNIYRLSNPSKLNIELVFDATMPGNSKKLEDRLKKLNKLCCAVNSSTGEPNFLSISWGRMAMGGTEGRIFAGRATDFVVNYTLFDRDGTPLRANVSLALAADSSLALQKAKLGQLSPQKVVFSVPDKSSLSMVASMGGKTLKGGIDPLTLADSNDLDSLNGLKPGQILTASASGG